MYKPDLEDPELRFHAEQDKKQESKRDRDLKGNFQFFNVDLRAALRTLDNLEEKALAAEANRKRRKSGK